MIDEGDLMEWAEVHGNLYGTPARNVERARDAGRHPLLDIDVQGARQIRERFPEAVLIFVLPPSAEALRLRLSARGTEGPDEVRGRLLAASRELGEASGFDHVVVNDDLDRAVSQVRSIVEAHRAGGGRGADLSGEVRRIREEIERVLERLHPPDDARE
jgi:guanylate kinase